MKMRDIQAGGSSPIRVLNSTYSYTDKSEKKVTIPRVHEKILGKNPVTKWIDDRTDSVHVDRDQIYKEYVNPGLKKFCEGGCGALGTLPVKEAFDYLHQNPPNFP
jgi:hypothetical protein